jgi:hypothetical protein
MSSASNYPSIYTFEISPLHIEDSKELLEPLLQKLGGIDFFIHDSMHTYEHMMWEFRTT